MVLLHKWKIYFSLQSRPVLPSGKRNYYCTEWPRIGNKLILPESDWIQSDKDKKQFMLKETILFDYNKDLNGKILITGSEGQLGNAFKQLLENFEYELIFASKSNFDITLKVLNHLQSEKV